LQAFGSVRSSWNIRSSLPSPIWLASPVWSVPDQAAIGRTVGLRAAEDPNHRRRRNDLDDASRQGAEHALARYGYAVIGSETSQALHRIEQRMRLGFLVVQEATPSGSASIAARWRVKAMA